MSTNGRPLIWGIGIRILNGDTQKALDLAGRLFHAGYGRPPTHVALPPDCDPASVNIYTLQLGHCTGPGSVVVGEACTEST